jgi:dTDP-4-amino-4,6-dideoxygalactose transaminase
MFSAVGRHRCTPAEVDSIVATLHAGWLAPGTKSSVLEQELAAKCSKKYGLLLNSSKSAVFLACIACRVGEGTEVFVSSLAPSFHTAILAALRARITYVDVSRDTLLPILPAHGHGVFLASNLLTIPDAFAGTSLTVVEDLHSAAVSSTGSAVSIISFDDICGIALFDDRATYEKALGIRDWGRIGSQDEDVTRRYGGDVLGRNVLYDSKFTYANIGFNLKSCEMAASLALDRLHSTPNLVPVLLELRNSPRARVSTTGHLIVAFGNADDLLGKLSGSEVSLGTLESWGFQAHESGVATEIFREGVIIIATLDEAKDRLIVASLA